MHLSNTELTLLAISTLWFDILRNKVFIVALGYMGSASLKTSRPHRLPLRGKKYGPQKEMHDATIYGEGSFIAHGPFACYMLV
jgi:hypothetical protein